MRKTLFVKRIEKGPAPEQGRFRNGEYLIEVVEEDGRTAVRLSYVETSNGKGEVGIYEMHVLDLLQDLQDSREPQEYSQFDDDNTQTYTSGWPEADDDNVVFVDFRNPVMVAAAMKHGFKPVDIDHACFEDHPVYGPYTVNFLLSKLRQDRSAKTFKYMRPDGLIEERSIVDEILRK